MMRCKRHRVRPKVRHGLVSHERRTPVWVVLVSVTVLAGCGESTSSTAGGGGAAGAGTDAADGASTYQLCDGSSELRLGYQVLGGGQMTLGTPLLTQNGAFYLFIDGTCRYWAFGPKGTVDWWQATSTGVLSPEQVESLSADLDLASWSDRHEVDGWCDAPTVFLWRKGALLIWSHNCNAPDPPAQIIPDLNDKVHTWLDELWTKGSAVDTPVRFAAIAIPPSLDDPSRPTATLSIDLAPIALSYPQGYQLEQSTPALLVSEQGVLAELRKERESLIAGKYLLFDGDAHVLPVRQDGVPYFVYFRDTIPPEDPNGLIRPPSGN